MVVNFKVTQDAISKFNYIKNLGIHILNSQNGLLAQVIKDTTKIDGSLIGSNFYFDSSRYYLENIPEVVIIKAADIEAGNSLEPFEFEVSYVDSCPW
jgi:hypothetical protein